MASRTRRLAVCTLLGGASLVGVATVWIVACGLPLTGLGGAAPEDASIADGGSDAASAEEEGEDVDAGPPTPCTTPDAACVGVLPPGWRPVGVSDAGCGADFDAATLLVNPRVGDGGCACGACQLVGSFACGGAVAVSGGDSCNDPTLVNAVPSMCTTAQAQHVEAHPPIATGAVSCFVPGDAGTGVTTDTLTVCIPGCSADYCGSSSRCILSDGAVPCPAGFTLLAQAGTGADPGCPSCPCEAGAPGPCGGTVTVFGSGGCADSGGAMTYPVGACNQFSTTVDYNSLIVDLVPPTPSCSVSSATPGPADASLLGVHTVCCQ